MTNLRAIFWAATTAISLIAVVLTIGAYTGEFGFSGSGQAGTTDVVQAEGASQSDIGPPAPVDAALQTEYEDDDWEEGGEHEDGGEREREGHDDDGERDD